MNRVYLHLNELAALNLIIQKFGYDYAIAVQENTRSVVSKHLTTIKDEMHSTLNNVALRRL